MDLYNTHKLNELKKQLEKVDAQQTQLVIFTCETNWKLNHIAELTKLLKNHYSHSQPLLNAHITCQNLDNDCQHVMDAIKAAQMHQLLLELLSHQVVEDIFEAISNWAFCNKMKLLISHPNQGVLLCCGRKC